MIKRIAVYLFFTNSLIQYVYGKKFVAAFLRKVAPSKRINY